jgi:hypothetical protein
LFSQNNDNYKVHVVADAPYKGFDDVIEVFTGTGKLKVSTLNGPHKDWGHTARNYGLDRVTEDWVVMSGDDNYYTPVFVDNFLRGAKYKPDVGFVYCDLVHNWANEQYLHLKSSPQIGKIDIGNFMVKSNLIGDLRLDPSKVISDGIFVEDYIKKNKDYRVVKIDKILYVHN